MLIPLCNQLLLNLLKKSSQPLTEVKNIFSCYFSEKLPLIYCNSFHISFLSQPLYDVSQKKKEKLSASSFN